MPHNNDLPRALVVGAAGQVGHALASLLGPEALLAGRTQKDATWLQVDLASLADKPSLAAELLAPLNLSAIYCVGGATDVERCESDAPWAEAVNHLGPTALARAAHASRIPFVFFSTDYVFDGAAGPYPEDAPTNPLSVYGRSKLHGERDVLDAHASALVLRTTTVFGPDPQGKNFLYTLRRLLTSGQTMRVPTDQFANPTYNQDLAAAAIALLRSGHTGVFHAAGPEYMSRLEFAHLACDILNLDASLIQPVTTADLKQAAQRPLLSGLRTEKLLSAIPDVTLKSPAEGIEQWRRLIA